MFDQERISREKTRGDCYQCLASCFNLPRKEQFFRERTIDILLDALKAIHPRALKSSYEMGNALLKYSDEELSVEYAKLFVGPFELKAPPYGSVYLEKEGKVMGDSTMEVVRMYRQSGLTIKEDFKELPDHITVELEFMYYMIFREIEFINASQNEQVVECLEKQNIFLHRYLGQWIREFSQRIEESTDNDFYRSLGTCVLNYVDGEREYIKILCEEFQGQFAEGS